MISREEAKKYLADKERALRCALPHAKSGWFEETVKEIQALGVAIEALSQPERPKGRWVEPIECGLPDEFTGVGFDCSNCGLWSDTDYSFCPNCGADMRDGEEE